MGRPRWCLLLIASAVGACTVPTVDSGIPACEQNRLPEPWSDAVTYTLTGTAGVDGFLGDDLAVADVDGDGRDDLLLAGVDSPNAYLVLASTLAARGPGTYGMGEVASYTFTLEQWSYGGERGYDGYDVELVMRDGEIYLSNPVETDTTIPMAYRIPWPSLLAAGPGTHSPADVADVAFVGGDPGNVRLVCDVNGDGADDVFVAAHLVRGPIGPGTVDVDASGAPLEYVGSDDGGCTPKACVDLNGDGVDDVTMSCNEPEPGRSAVNVHYGSVSIGEAPIDLWNSDVTVRFPVRSGYDSISTSPESVTDWNQDGFMDLFVASSGLAADGQSYWHNVSAFFGDEGFRPSGTTLGESDRCFSLSEGGFISVASDLNRDGWNELILGQSLHGEANEGRLYVSYCPIPPGDHAIGEIDTVVYDGWTDPAMVQPINGESLGSMVTGGDIDGDGVRDLVIAAQAYPMDQSFVGAVHIALN